MAPIEPPTSPIKPCAPFKPTMAPIEPCSPIKPSTAPIEPCAPIELPTSPIEPCALFEPRMAPIKPCAPIEPPTAPIKPCAPFEPMMTPIEPCASIEPPKSPIEPCALFEPTTAPIEPCAPIKPPMAPIEPCAPFEPTTAPIESCAPTELPMAPIKAPAIGWLESALNNLALALTNDTAILQKLMADNLALTATVTSLTATNKKLVDVATRKGKPAVTPVGGGHATRNPFPGNHCWTHGHRFCKDHTSASCTHKAPGHRNDTTAANTSSGSDKDKGWDAIRTYWGGDGKCCLLHF